MMKLTGACGVDMESLRPFHTYKSYLCVFWSTGASLALSDTMPFSVKPQGYANRADHGVGIYGVSLPPTLYSQQLQESGTKY